MVPAEPGAQGWAGALGWVRSWVCTCAFWITWLHLAECGGDTGLRKGQQAGWGGQLGLWAGRPRKGCCQLEAAGAQRDEGSGPLGVKLTEHLALHHSGTPCRACSPQRPDPSTGKASRTCPGSCVVVTEQAAWLLRSRLRLAPLELRGERAVGCVPALWALRALLRPFPSPLSLL